METPNPETQTVPPTFFTVKQFCQRHEWAAPGGVRHLIFNAEQNGFSKCIKRIGRKVLIDESAVFLWIEEKNAGDNP